MRTLDQKNFRRALIGACAGLVLTTAFAVAADVRGAAHQFDIPAQPLADALQTLAFASQHKLLYDTVLVKGKSSPALKGEFTTEEAVKKLLSGTNLSYEVTSDGLVLIRAASEPVSSGALADGFKPIRLASSQAPASSATNSASHVSQDHETVVDEVTVYGRGVRAESVREIPQSVTVLNRELLDAVPGVTVQDVIRFIPSAANYAGDYNYGGASFIRGSVFTPTWNNAIIAVTPGKLELANVERVEVLMGPTSVLYGSMSPGALVNVVTKQPEPTFHSEVNLQAGSFDSYGGSVDIGGPVSGRLRVRLNASYLDSGAPFDHWNSRTTFVAPVMAFDLTDRTLLTVEGSYRRASYPGGVFAAFVPTTGTVRPNPNGTIPLASNLGYMRDVTHFADDYHNGNLRLRHEFSDALSLNVNVEYGARDNSGIIQNTVGALRADSRTISRSLSSVFYDQEGTSASLSLLGRFTTGSATHEMILGFDYFDNSFDGSVGSYGLSAGVLQGIDVYAPDYSYSVRDQLVQTSNFTYEGANRAAAVFLQDRVVMGKLALSGGVRYTDSKSAYLNTGTGIRSPDTLAKQVSPQIGALYNFSDTWLLFANRSSSFMPRAPVAARDGSVLSDPETAVQYELGTRYTFPNSGFTANLALFHITRPDVYTLDPVDTRFYVDSGEIVSKGVEVSASGVILPDWNVFVGYAYNPTEITKTNRPGERGRATASAPKNTISAISRYSVSGGPLQGLGFFAAVNHLGTRYADAANTLLLPSSTRLDLGVTYRWDEAVEFGFTANNLTNEQIYGGLNALTVSRGAERNYMFNVRMWPGNLQSR